MPPQKYFTEEERIQAQRQQYKEYYQRHRELVLQRKKQYHQTHKEHELLYRKQHREEKRLKNRLRRGYKYVLLTDAEKVDDSQLECPNDWIKQQIESYQNTLNIDEFADFIRTHDMNDDENINEAFRVAERLGLARRSGKGQYFERLTQKLMLNKFEETPFKVYRQVPYGNINDYRYCRKIDFVVSEEDNEKDKLDLSKSVIVSCKTTLGTAWREDEAIFSKCKAYIMISLDNNIPTDPLPDNVFFCVPDMEFNDHIIDMNYFTDFIIQKLTDHI